MSLDAPLSHCFWSIGPLRNGEDVAVTSLVDVFNLCLCHWLAVVDKVIAHCKGWCLALLDYLCNYWDVRDVHISCDDEVK